MAIEVFPDSPSLGISPRISFSHDLAQSDVVPVEQYIRTTSSSTIDFDFDFCVFRESFDHQSSSADELFFDGKILPIEIKRKLPPPPRTTQTTTTTPPPPPQKPSKPTAEAAEDKQRSFWRFKRSSSLNCGSGYGRTLCPLPLLSRSNSTGSAASGKQGRSSSNQKQSFLKSSSSSSSTSQKQGQSGNYSSWSRPPLKKQSYGSYGGGLKFNPVLNVPPANLFGLGSIFSGGKDRSKKKY